MGRHRRKETKVYVRRSFMEIYFRLVKYLRYYWWPFALSLAGYFILASSNPLLAKLLGKIVEAIQNKDSDARFSFAAMGVGIAVLRGFGTFLGNYYNDYVGASLVNRIKMEVFDHLTVLPASYFESQTQGFLLHRLTSGVRGVERIVVDASKTFVREGLSVLALLATAFYLNWRLSIVFLVVAPFIFMVLKYTNARFIQIARKNEGILGKAMQVAKEVIAHHGIVRVFGAEEYERNRYHTALRRSFQRQMKIRKISSISTPVIQGLAVLAFSVIVFLLLDPRVLATTSAEKLTSYLTVIGLLPKSMKQLGGLGAAVQKSLVGVSMVFDILDTPPELNSGTHVSPRVKGDVELRNVSFRYPQATQNAIDGVSLDIRSGEMVALIGKSGAGKTTLVSLLYRLHDVTEGGIYIDGVDIRDYDLMNLRRHISIVSQHVALFDDTIRNNIGYGKANCTDEEILNAARRAQALEFIQDQPLGLDTVIGDSGLKLSGGQRQRIAIARAFLKDAPILILDEATSALDNQSENLIKQAIDEITQNRTTIVIAHRLTTIEKADRVVVMDQGRIVEMGTHTELLSKGGHYSALYNVS